MKIVLFLLAATVFAGFSNKPADEELDGYWMGYYRSNTSKEKVIVKLNSGAQMDFYTGGIDDHTKREGTYQIKGDSVYFSYKSANGEDVSMQGHFNRRKTYMDGICRTNNKPTGSFYLEKQKLQERIVSKKDRSSRLAISDISK